VTQLAQGNQIDLSHYRRLLDRQSAGGGFAPALRRAGIERFETVGFPTTRQEAWRFTSLAPLARLPFVLAEPDVSDAVAEIARRHTLGPETAAEIVVVNAHYSPKLSRTALLPRGVIVTSLASALQRHAPLIEPHLAQHARIDAHPLVALNTGFLNDGVFIHIPRGVELHAPIHLLFVASPGERPAVAHPRTLIVLDEGARATIVETYVGSDAVYWTNAVTECAIGPSAAIDHCVIQQESDRAFHTASTQVALARQAAFVSHSATLGAMLSRNDLNVSMDGRAAEATLNGLIVLNGRRHADHHTLLDHAQPNCPSHELYKYILSDQSVGVFNGKILVRPDARRPTASRPANRSCSATAP